MYFMVAADNVKFSQKPTMTSYLPYPSGGCVTQLDISCGKFKTFGFSLVLVVFTFSISNVSELLLFFRISIEEY